MKSDRQEKIGFLSRAARGKVILPTFLASLSVATESEMSESMLTDLPGRDQLLAHFREGYASSKASGAVKFSKTYEAGKRDTLFKVISCFAERVDEPVFLLTRDSEFCGAVRLHGGQLLRHCEAVLGIDGDAVMVLSEDHKQGVLLDYAPDDPESCYELTVWGAIWPLSILNCDR